MKTIGILYMATGPYIVFWEQFYKSFEAHFLPGVEKHYYIFTDAKSIHAEDNNRVHKTYARAESWPLPTLLKYHHFLEIEEQLKKHDYLYQANGNSCCVSDVREEDFLPRTEMGEELIFTTHPGYRNCKPWRFPYERDYHSEAYVPYNRGRTYVFGAMNGGTADAYIRMMKVLDYRITEDLKKNIIAKWHDESHVNHYFCKASNYRLLSAEYAWQGAPGNDRTVYITCIDKNLFLNVAAIKNNKVQQKIPLKRRIIQAIWKRTRVVLAMRDWCLRKKI